MSKGRFQDKVPISPGSAQATGIEMLVPALEPVAQDFRSEARP